MFPYKQNEKQKQKVIKIKHRKIGKIQCDLIAKNKQ